MKPDHSPLGATIPLHYHYNMLNDEMRMDAFQKAVALAVGPSHKVLELGGGSGVLSFFAAKQGAKVYCVELLPDNLAAARKLLELNGVADRVETICADAMEYLPPEPVDVVICEMLHVGLLREKQVEVIESFKKRYAKTYGDKLPVMIPWATLLGVQPVAQDFAFHGFHAPVPLFQQPNIPQPRTTELGPAMITHTLDYSQPIDPLIGWSGELPITQNGNCNALRFTTKNLLAADTTNETAVEWFNQYLIMPLRSPIEVKAGSKLSLKFHYHAGDELSALENSIVVTA